MTIVEAIKILTKLERALAPAMATSDTGAIRLGIEALKRVREERTGYETYAPDLLPGETGK